MSSDVTVVVDKLSKTYRIFKRPEDRLKQMLSFGRGRFYSEFCALRDVSFSVGRGETVGILGRNGAGKSTLLQIICGTAQPSAGQVQVNGRVAALLELGAGFNPEFTGRENVYLSASILGLTKAEIDARYSQITDFAGIGDFIEQPVKLYSSGMYARLAFAVAAHVDADVLIVDEVLSVGDAAFTQKCMRFIHMFKEHGTLLFVSHDTASVTSLCDRAIWMDRGELRAQGVARDVAHAYVAALYSEQDTTGEFRIGGERRQRVEGRKIVDPRDSILQQSQHRNEIEVFDFDPNGPWFGQRGATIENAQLCNTSDRPLQELTGGEEIILQIDAIAHRELDRPILGFSIKNRLGQNLFGDNTYLTFREAPLPARAGDRITARFRFQMPYLPSGDYSVNTAIANGTQIDHVQHHWVDDALFFKVNASHVAKGLVGIPMLEIDLKIEALECSQPPKTAV
jgi:lipopolysaccharide transport system ATP-binding protein